ncbi:MAG: glycoside hydrolase family 76 protein [Dehalococcoidales bacterium]|nr:glycoside hydrolase family 76 protein [Dehalococcoidales bacterium]
MNFPKCLTSSCKYVLIGIILFTVISGGTLWFFIEQGVSPVEFSGGSSQFRDTTVQFARLVTENYFNEQPMQYPDELAIRGNWELNVTIYHQGEIKGEGKGKDSDTLLSLVLEEATLNAIDNGSSYFSKENIEDVRILISFPNQEFSFIEYNGEGKELIENLVINRSLNKELLLQKIEQGKEFLLRAVNKDEHGFYKKYDVLNDDFGDRLHTVYSASIIYTLLKIYDFDGDERIMEGIPEWADFMLSMQSKDRKVYGAFHYSYYYNTREKEPRFVVGTTALSIFTLLDLYDRTGEDKYLTAAELGGDWLVTMQKDDGWMKPYKENKNGTWVYGTQKSLLYNGQVLSALSRLYGVTGDQKYYNTAEKIAQNFTEKVEREGCYLGDDYRSKNPISSAWVIMSLMDFYKINTDDYYKNIILRCSSDILGRQQLDTNKLLYYGTWDDAYSTSGNGWLDEVMMEVYKFYQEHGVEGAGKYKEAAIRVTWWIIQNTYSAENTFFLKEPQKAIGGSVWNYKNLYVRTDSLCHAVNAYMGLVNEVEDSLLITVPEEPFDAVLGKMIR